MRWAARIFISFRLLVYFSLNMKSHFYIIHRNVWRRRVFQVSKDAVETESVIEWIISNCFYIERVVDLYKRYESKSTLNFRRRKEFERILPCFPDPASGGAGRRGATATPAARLAIAVDAQKRPIGESFNNQAIQSAQVSHHHEIWWPIISHLVVFISFFAILHAIRPFFIFFFLWI